MRHLPALALAASLIACGPPPAVDPEIARAIAGMKAFDNHAHPVRPTAAGEKPDDEFDALPVDSLEAQSDPVLQRGTSPVVVAAHRQLYGASTKADARKAHPDDYAAWALDQMGIETMVANRVAMGPGLPASRFLWVPFADALMYPLGTAQLVHNPDQRSFFPLEDKLLARYYRESGVTQRPATLGEYLTKVVSATLERHKKGGAVAEKYEMAYLRSLAVGNPSRAEAERAWAGGGDYTALQDYIFRYIALECGRLGMGVHLHVAHGGGGYFNTSWANPLLLEPLLNDPTLRKTTFVMIHGGWPWTREITPLLTKPNAYVDYSEQLSFDTPHNVAEALRGWLAYVPEKVLFATDAYPFSAELGWEEAGVVAANASREALGRALTAMLRDGEITRERAVELATMVMRENARKLYGLGDRGR
ncbi:MAG: amidohydrolase family protein [Gemmatimonadetes bacterium]|nr:amidohydrolase family protein [Gemmatimonadota bacterium]